jgi:tRNA threonylcarbamoyladenosine biosynthesis protein TsaB
MRLLAFDTSTEVCSVALRDGAAEFVEVEHLTRGHATRLLPMIDAVLRKAGLTLAVLDGLAVIHGPGTFTGVRIAVSVAQGLAFGAQLPVVPVSSLEALGAAALAADPGRPCFVCLDARMSEIYYAAYEASDGPEPRALTAPSIGAPDSIVLPTVAHYSGYGRGLSAYPRLAERLGLITTADSVNALPDIKFALAIGATPCCSFVILMSQTVFVMMPPYASQTCPNCRRRKSHP